MWLLYVRKRGPVLPGTGLLCSLYRARGIAATSYKRRIVLSVVGLGACSGACTFYSLYINKSSRGTMGWAMVQEVYLGRSLPFLVHQGGPCIAGWIDSKQVVFEHHMISPWSAFAHYARLCILSGVRVAVTTTA